MRIAAVLPFVLIAVTTAAQAPTPQPTAPTAGAAGATSPQPPSTTAPTPSKDPNTGSIRGRVLRADDRQPLNLARVTTEFGADVALSAEDGRFELRGLPAGTYKLLASKTGFVTMFSGQRGNEAARAVELAAGQVVNNVDFALLRGGVISGVVLDDLGEPLPEARVWLLRPRYQNGERTLIAEFGPESRRTGGSGALDLTDDLGQFRLFGLMPGTYYLAASASSRETGSSRSAPNVADGDATLYPGTFSLASALPILVRVGE